MATPAAIPPNTRSGGKIVRPRRGAGIGKTPYDRPSAPQPSNVDVPDSNWLARLIVPPTRFIAKGVGSFVDSIFRSSSTSTSEYSSDSGSDYLDDGEDENVEDKEDDLKEYVDANNESGVKKPENHIQDFVWSSDSKGMIARLLSRESFSREECDQLKNIIDSRVSATVGNDVEGSELRSNAIIEAKRWIEEKSKPDLESELCVLNYFEEGENTLSSPVDVAKSYMQARPPWSSSSISHIPNSPSPNEMQLLNNQSPIPFNESLYKQLDRTPLSGSWSILEEVRKVRSKATEDLLRSRPSMPDDTVDVSLKSTPLQSAVFEANQTAKESVYIVEEDPSNEKHEHNNSGFSDVSPFELDGASQQKDSEKETESTANGHASIDVGREENNHATMAKQVKRARERPRSKVGAPKGVAPSRVRGRPVTERKKEVRGNV